MSHKTLILAVSTAFLSLLAILFINQTTEAVPVQVKASSHIVANTASQFETEVEVKPTYSAPSLPKTSKVEVNTNASAAPVQTSVSQDPAWPVRLDMPSLGISAPIIAMGLTSDGKMAVPDNFTEIGWYKLGTVPGTQGSAVLGAHVDNGGKISGVFKNLKDLNIGDIITITDANGQLLQFRVVERKIYDYRHQDTQEIFGDVAGKKRLNLITCHGRFMSEENTYDQRLVVFTELVN